MLLQNRGIKADSNRSLSNSTDLYSFKYIAHVHFYQLKWNVDANLDASDSVL